MFFIKYVTKPISTMFYVAGRQREDFFLQILFLALTAGIPLAVFMALKKCNRLDLLNLGEPKHNLLDLLLSIIFIRA